MSDKKSEVGSDSVLIGVGKVGDRSVVINAADENGNIILNRPMAIGHNAMAGPNSIAIGSGACVGTSVIHLLNTLKNEPSVQVDGSLTSIIDALNVELQSSKPEKERISSLWSLIEKSAAVSGSLALVQQIGSMLFS
ncbi:hypothetical protein ABVF78_004245 [Vibrio alginolyticus]|nr:hypothetical protein [Vibrio alginolyticus]